MKGAEVMLMRQRWIDIFKGIGIILMVIGHADAPTF